MATHLSMENPIDRGAWWPTVHGVAKSQTPEKAMAPHSSTLACKIPWMEKPGRLQSMGLRRVGHDWLHFHFHALEKEMKTHSSVLAWKIPGTGEPGGLPSLGSHRVGHDWSDLAAAAAAAAWFELFCFLNLWFGIYHYFRGILSYYCFKYFFFSSPSGIPIMHVLHFCNSSTVLG